VLVLIQNQFSSAGLLVPGAPADHRADVKTVVPRNNVPHLFERRRCSAFIYIYM